MAIIIYQGSSLFIVKRVDMLLEMSQMFVVFRAAKKRCTQPYLVQEINNTLTGLPLHCCSYNGLVIDLSCQTLF